MTKLRHNTPILVTGIPRSGSTWLGKMLSLASNVQYLHEPFHPNRKLQASPLKDFFPYLKGEDSKDKIEGLYNYMQDVLSYRVPGLYDSGDKRNARKIRWIYQPMAGFYHRTAHHIPLQKDPPALLAAEWLEKYFNSRVVLVVRHPAAFVASLNKTNWPRFGMNTFLSQEDLMTDLLSGFKTELEEDVKENTSVLQNQVLFWRIMHHVIHVYKEQHPSWIVVRHEDVSNDPVNMFKELYEQLDLNFSKKVLHTIEEATSAQNESRLTRDSKKNAQAWKRLLSDDEIHKIKEYSDDVDNYFYTNDDW